MICQKNMSFHLKLKALLWFTYSVSESKKSFSWGNACLSIGLMKISECLLESFSSSYEPPLSSDWLPLRIDFGWLCKLSSCSINEWNKNQIKNTWRRNFFTSLLSICTIACFFNIERIFSPSPVKSSKLSFQK